MYTVLYLWLAICLGASSAQSPAKKRVAVLDFENAAIQTAAAGNSSAGTQPADIGKSVSQLLIARLAQDGAVTLVERADLDKVIGEQNFSNSDRADPQTAAKLGKLLGVDAIILGAITRYDYSEQIHKASSFFGASNSPKAKYDISAKVEIIARVVSTDTAQVLATSSGIGETERKDVKVDLRDKGARAVMASGVNNPVMNESIDKALAQLGPQLELNLAAVPRRANQR